MAAGLDFELHATLDGLAARLAAEPHGHRGGGQVADRHWAAELWYVSAPLLAFLGSAAPFANSAWGPNTGYAWAVQRLTVAGLATTDSATVYRGYSTADAVPQNIVAPPLVPSAPTYNPGKTGLILMGDQSLVFGGTLTAGTLYVVSADVIQVTLDRLPRFME